MNWLGRNPESCVAALAAYLSAISALNAEAESNSSTDRAADTTALLQRIVFQLNVDVLAREGPIARERMTSCEERHLVPALRRLTSELSRISPDSHPATWRDSLAGGTAVLEHALRRFRRIEGRRHRRRGLAQSTG